jgi:hypothetical protein
MASAQQIVALNTENTGASVGSAGADKNWSMVSYYDWYGLSGGGTTNYTGSAAYAYVATTYPNSTYWTPNTTSPTAKWIAPQANQGTGAVGSGAAPGIYTYQLTFTSSIARTVQISGEVAADNQFGIVYNGVVEVSGPGGGTSTDSSSASYLFTKSNTSSQFGGQYGSNAPILFNFDVTAHVGTNIVDFLVNNLQVTSDSPYNNASGLFVTDFEVQVVPEPPTWAIVLAGLGGLLVLRRIRTAQAVKAATQPHKIRPSEHRDAPILDDRGAWEEFDSMSNS